MRIIVAEAMGMCFGVRDALAVARSLPMPAAITVHGQLVHNPAVVAELRGRGFQLCDSPVGTPMSEQVLITAHGISHAERDRLKALGKRLIDTTCPLVRRAHDAAMKLQEQGYFVVVVGKRDHVEVRGITGDLSQFAVIGHEEEVERWAHHQIGIIAQTTTTDSQAAAIVERIRQLNPHADVRFVNTICQPTKDRQGAMERLLTQVDVLVVVGGRHSNNTQQLVRGAEDRHVRAIHVEEACELCESLFAPTDVVGLTAGTSTLPETVERVHSRLAEFHAHTNR